MAWHRRRLPHWRPDGKCLFLTWHLHGSLPADRYPPPNTLSAAHAFVWIDRYLDTTRVGPRWLVNEKIAQVVVDALHYGAATLKHYELHAFAVMSNHVHVLLLPLVAPPKLLHSLKGFTAREANKILNRTGEPFWQGESYDHWVRDQREFEKIRAYIEGNPVKAGLVIKPEDYAWSSAKAGTIAGLPA